MDIQVVPSAACNPVTGQYDATWHLTHQLADPVMITSAKVTATPPGTATSVTFSPNPIPSGQSATAFTSHPGTTTNLVLDFLYTVGSYQSGKNELFVLPAQPCTATAVLTVGPTAARSGETVTISGTGCILDATNGTNSAVAFPGVVTGTVAFTPPLPFGPIDAAADGTWSTTIVVPPGTPPGTHAVNATCTLPAPPPAGQVSAQAAGTFQYAPGTLTVTIPAAPKFTG